MKHFASKADSLNLKARLLRALAVIALLAGSSQAHSAESTNAPSRLTYDSFRMVSDRNIFNPNRYSRGTGRPTRTSSQPAARVESFSLVGIMAYEKGIFAFFDGTKSDYKQALQTDGTIGEYKVISVSTEDVKLVSGTNTFDLKVGMQMRREDEGDWFLSDGGDAPRKRIVSNRTRTRSGGSATAVASEEMATSGEPEVIVVENEAQTESTTGETLPNNGNGNGGTEAAPAEAAADNGGVTDPVLLRLMQRRQQMNQ